MMSNKQEHLFQWWKGYFLLLPLRKFAQDPYKILKPFITKDFNIIDFGPAMGYFSIPIAQMTGKNGKVFCLDIQDGVLSVLKKRVTRNKIKNIEAINILNNQGFYKNHENDIDFILAFAVLHEVPDKNEILKKFYKVLKKNGKILIAEPTNHSGLEYFSNLISEARKIGFKIDKNIVINRSRSVILKK